MAGNREGARKALITRSKKHGADYYKRIGLAGGRLSTRGYFGKLKDEGRVEELKTLARKGVERSNEVQAKGRKDVEQSKDSIPGAK